MLKELFVHVRECSSSLAPVLLGAPEPLPQCHYSGGVLPKSLDVRVPALAIVKPGGAWVAVSGLALYVCEEQRSEAGLACFPRAIL